MNSQSTVIVWGWLRIVIGLLQMGLSVAAFTLLIRYGFEPISIWCVGGATAATAVSLYLYRRRKRP